jgi:peroxiredoxin
MSRLNSFTALLSILLASNALASPAEAERIQKSYQLALEKWTLEFRKATTSDERAKAWSSRPDATATGKKIWNEISASLGDESSIRPASWFLDLTRGLVTTDPNGSSAPTFAREAESIRQAVQSYHMDSEKLQPMCAALAASHDPRSLSLLEKIQATHPNKSIQGIAALGAAMQLKTIGDSPELMQKRLGYIRKAIIQSSDQELNGIAVPKIAEDELYIIRYLTKGRVAPDLVGTDPASKPLSLSSQKGKVIVLVFWSSTDPDADRVMELTAAMVKKFSGQPLVIIGVNHDSTEKLRALTADGSVTWQNFSDPGRKLSADYRVGSWPLAYVLDSERKIHYAGAPGSFVELTADALVSELKNKK